MSGDSEHRAKQFIALLHAASQTYKYLTTIKGVRLEWEIFETPDQLEKMLGALKHLQHLHLAMLESDTEGYRKNLARLIAAASDLKTLELCFGYLPMEDFHGVIALNQLLKHRVHWPILQRLVLQGFSTTEKAFSKFLKSHDGSLKALELSNLSFYLSAATSSQRVVVHSRL